MPHTKNKEYSSRILSRYFSLAALEGVFCLLLLVWLPSDQKTAWLFGFSQLRIIMLVAAFSGILLFGYLVRKSRDQLWAQSLWTRVEKSFRSENFLVRSITILLIVFLLGLIFLYSSFTQTDFLIRPHLIRTVELIRTSMDRLTPFVIWLTALSLQTLVFLSVLGYGTKARFYKAVRIISILIFPLLIGLIIVINQIDDKYYAYLTNEDQIVEWLTFACLVIAGLLSLWKAFQARKMGSSYIWFYLLFGIGCIILGFEEISWGQRVFQLESSEFFLTNSDQQEINAHNVVNKWFNVRTKHIAAFVLFIFGVGLPLLALNSKIKLFFEKIWIVVPPIFLSIGFALGAFLTLDIFSGREEEIAELFLSLNLLLFIILENLKPNVLLDNPTPPDRQPVSVDA